MKSVRFPSWQDETTDQPVETHFASPERKTSREVEEDVSKVTADPVVSGLMTIANGLLAVLNERRQVVAINDVFLREIGVADAAGVLGLRYGETLQCVHSCEMKGGCGTSRHCSSCGAALAIVSALSDGLPQERTCAMAVERDLRKSDLYFNVRSYPFKVGEDQFLLLFMQDITVQQHRACLDRTFFHDINNMLCGLIGKSEVLASDTVSRKEKVKDLQLLVMRIAQEIRIHNSFQKTLDDSYKPTYGKVPVASILKEIDQLFQDHALAADKKLRVSYPEERLDITTDSHLVSRIIANMVTNGLEAAPGGSEVTLETVNEGNRVSFHVGNEGEIPPEVALRIFQRNFSTKGSVGRGFGTYSMKLFGEDILGGKVSFESGASGTVFTLSLPTN